MRTGKGHTAVKAPEKLTVKYHSRKVGELSLTPDNRLCAFEYDPGWLSEGFSISPLELPLKPGLFLASPEPFYGDFGIFEDSLPDGYGRYLLHKVLEKKGINDFDLNSIQRLSILGNGGMGALTYEPQTPLVLEEGPREFDRIQQAALEVLQERNNADEGFLLRNSGNSGGCRPKLLYSDSQGHWLVKLRNASDPLEAGAQEFHYNETARRCGIDVADFKLIEGKYFASRRFDISPEGERRHVATVGGLCNISLETPVLDYKNLLALTGYLTRNPKALEEMFRRMAFNYLADNKDDHCKNFSFICRKGSDGKHRWELSPAYDLTLCRTGYNGEHATSVNGTGHPCFEDMAEIGTKYGISKSRCREIFDQVRDNCGDLLLNDID